ncbi:MAG: branched-chain amino acid ABC transporter permease [Alphaproteobacteria bacterium]|nr:MAG: branched-chain amino acid ABC transporter permease [Alphaproteobacteria bacterium]
MDTVTQVIVSGLTLGAMYAVSTASLSLVWGALNMLNMAQGAMLTVGGYVAYAAVSSLQLPPIVGLLLTVIVGAVLGLLLYLVVVRRMLDTEGFEVAIIIATVGAGTVLENLMQKIFGAYPLRQPFTVEGGFFIGATHVPYNSVIIFAASILLMLGLAAILARTRMGRAIRAVSQNRDAAQLMGVPVQLAYAQVLLVAGALAAISGVMLSTITTLAPTMGYDPMLKAFIICVVAGLGNVMGALYAAFLLGVFEAFVQFSFGVRFAFPAMLLLVIVTLIWRPYGLFGRTKASRL